MLDQRRKRWADVVQMLYKCFWFAGCIQSIVNPYKAEIFLYKPWRPKGFSIWNHHKVNSFRFSWIPMLWVYGHHNFLNSFSAGTDFRSQNLTSMKMKWNESGFRPLLCTYRLNWARRTSWGWWDDWDDTVLQTQDSKFEPWRSEAEHATSRSRRLPTMLTFTRGWGRNIFCFFQTAETGNRAPNSGPLTEWGMCARREDSEVIFRSTQSSRVY